MYISGPVTIQDNLFLENVASDHGGGIYVANSGPRVPTSQIDIYENVFVSNQALGLDQGFDCSGGAIWVSGGAHIHENTIAFNYADSQNYPAAGGICLVNSDPDMVIEKNIIFQNGEAGLVAWRYSGSWGASVLRNLFYANDYQDIYNQAPNDIALYIVENLFEDPMFCILGSGSRGELAGTSPALNQPYGVIGAVAEPGCDPYPGTWGSIRGRTPWRGDMRGGPTSGTRISRVNSSAVTRRGNSTPWRAMMSQSWQHPSAGLSLGDSNLVYKKIRWLPFPRNPWLPFPETSGYLTRDW